MTHYDGLWPWSLYPVPGLWALFSLLRRIENVAVSRGQLGRSWSVALFSFLSPYWIRSPQSFEHGCFYPLNRIVEWNELKMFSCWFNDCILGQFFFQLCITRPLATHLTFLKQRSSSVIGWSTAQSSSEKKCSGRQKTSSQLGSRIVVAFFSWCFLLYLCFRYIILETLSHSSILWLY